MTADIVSRPGRLERASRPVRDRARQVWTRAQAASPYLRRGRHHRTAGPNLRTVDLTGEPTIEIPAVRPTHAAPLTGWSLLAMRGGIALAWLAFVLLVLANGGTDAATVVGDVTAAAAVPLLRPLAALRRLRHHVAGVEVFDPRDYALVVTMHADTGEVRVQHQAGDNALADRDMARLAAEIIDQVGVAAVNRECVLIETRRAGTGEQA